MDMETQNSKDRAKYAHLKRDILGDGIKESKLTAYETLAKNLDNNSGDDSESLHVYGMFYLLENYLRFFEVKDTTHPTYDLLSYDAGFTPEVKKMIFDGEYIDGDHGYVDTISGKAIHEPSLMLEDANSGIHDFFVDHNGTENLLDFLGIGNCIIFAMVNGGDPHCLTICKHISIDESEIPIDGFDCLIS